MADITWEDAFCAEGNNCYRFGTDGAGNSYIAIASTRRTRTSPTPPTPSAS